MMRDTCSKQAQLPFVLMLQAAVARLHLCCVSSHFALQPMPSAVAQRSTQYNLSSLVSCPVLFPLHPRRGLLRPVTVNHHHLQCYCCSAHDYGHDHNHLMWTTTTSRTGLHSTILINNPLMCGAFAPAWHSAVYCGLRVDSIVQDVTRQRPDQPLSQGGAHTAAATGKALTEQCGRQPLLAAAGAAAADSARAFTGWPWPHAQSHPSS